MKTILFLFIFCLSAFSSFSKATGDTLAIEKVVSKDSLINLYHQYSVNIDSTSNLFLYEDVSTWLGTHYSGKRMGKEGIDCSGFSTAIYNEVYHIGLNGGSRDIIHQVDTVFRKKDELKEGDLVFFKIHKKRVSHVGIYLKDNKFVHSSTHNGVIISDLDEPYYKRTYYRAGRFKNLNK